MRNPKRKLNEDEADENPPRYAGGQPVPRIPEMITDRVDSVQRGRTTFYICQMGSLGISPRDNPTTYEIVARAPDSWYSVRCETTLRGAHRVIPLLGDATPALHGLRTTLDHRTVHLSPDMWRMIGVAEVTAPFLRVWRAAVGSEFERNGEYTLPLHPDHRLAVTPEDLREDEFRQQAVEARYLRRKEDQEHTREVLDSAGDAYDDDGPGAPFRR